MALSPELGTSFKKTDNFIIKDQKILKDVILANQQWIWDSIRLLKAQLSFTYRNGSFYRPENSQSLDPSRLVINLTLKNKGLRALAGSSHKVEIKL